MRTLFSLCLFFLLTAISTGCGGPTSESPRGTSAAALDADGDGIPDAWEQSGLDYTWAPDGSARHLDMRELGASPNHKDVFVWIAWMEAAAHTHRPSPEAIDLVTKAFELARVSNIDGRPGINLHVMLAPTPIPEQAMLGGGNGNDYDWSAFDALRSKYFPAAFGEAIFFAVFAHDMDIPQHSGIAKTIPGHDFIVSLGGFTNHVGNTYEQAGTFMHELGHSLGLHHGGTDDKGYKPNYLSVMNYFFQMDGLTINGQQGHFRYSELKLATEESTLNERTGLTTDPAASVYGTYYFCASDMLKPVGVPVASGVPVDWNCDRRFDARVSTDINGDSSISGLSGASDWDNVVLKRSAATQGMAAQNVVGLKPAQELTAADADRIPLFPVTDIHATQRGDGVVVRWQRVPLDRVLAYRVYRSTGSADDVVATVDNTPSPSYIDAPPKGQVKYSVTAVFAPHGFAAQQEVPSLPAPPPPTPAGGRLVFHPSIFNSITGIREIQGIREGAPTQSGGFETAGITPPQSRSETSFPKVLFETPRSEAAAVVVR